MVYTEVLRSPSGRFTSPGRKRDAVTGMTGTDQDSGEVTRGENIGIFIFFPLPNFGVFGGLE